MIREVYCANCDILLTEEELQMYDYRCDNCEKSWFDRTEAWRRGGFDPELDRLYAAAALPARLH